MSLASHLQDDGVWFGVRRRPAVSGAGALFLDRDGVLVEEVGYLSRPEDVELTDGAAELVALANRLAVPVVVVTNQAGIARGFYDWRSFEVTQRAVEELLGRAGARLDAVLACPFHRDGRPPYRHPDHPARKPNPGMLLRAARELGLDLARSWLVGDAVTDVRAAVAAGLEGAVHVLTGHGARDRPAVLALRAGSVGLADTLREVPPLVPLLAAAAGGTPRTASGRAAID